ncbi:MAG TPA: hypothetical protein VLW65_05780 [Bryobacteraceae bacterium]|nr:hypothetical protein [Bryobacteraceae bacterium]
MRRLCALLAALPAMLAAAAAPHWEAQYLYDEDKSSLEIVDLQFASAKRGVAAGYIQQGNRQEPVSLVTADGGQHWQRVALKEVPVSLFFLNEGLGWMVTAKGHLWKTTEAGKTWTQMPKPPGEILRVYFLDERNGWAAGIKKSILATHDGGQHWSPVPAAAEPPGQPQDSAYTLISFATPEFGFIAGLNLPPQKFGPELPAWVDPEAAMDQHRLPHLIYTVTTRDGGKTWKSSSASVFGETSRVRFLPTGQGLGLMVYSQDFRYPSEVFKIDWRTGRSSTVYKDPKFAVTDIWLEPDGTAYLAGTVSQAKLRDIVPGKVQVLSSRDYLNWTELPVDYRASGHRVILAAAGDEIWMATDSGMILKLAR